MYVGNRFSWKHNWRHLAQGGSEVYFVDQWKEHIDKINENGLKMTDEKEEWFVKVDARTSAEGIGPVDLVIVLVKSFSRI